MGSNTLAITNRQWIWISGFIDLAGPAASGAASGAAGILTSRNAAVVDRGLMWLMLLLLLLVSTSATSSSNNTFVVLTLGWGCVDCVAARTTTILHSRRLAKVTNEELAQTRLGSKMSYLTAQIFHFLVAWLSLAFKGLPCLQACHLSQMHCGRPPCSTPLHFTPLHFTPFHSTISTPLHSDPFLLSAPSWLARLLFHAPWLMARRLHRLPLSSVVATCCCRRAPCTPRSKGKGLRRPSPHTKRNKGHR